MKPSPLTKSFLVATVLLCFQQAASADINATYNVGTSQDSFIGDISSTDLVEAGSSALSSVVVAGAGNPTDVNDGTAEPSGSEDVFGLPTVVFTLNTTVNVFGYDITGLNSFAGYADAQALGTQDFELYVEYVNNPGVFTDLGNFDNDFQQSTASQSTETLLTGTNGPGGDLIASGVEAVELVYSLPANNAGATNLQEIDINGVATVPEPSTWALLLAGVAAGFAVLRRRHSLI